MKNQKQSIRFRIFPQTKEKLEALARKFNYMYGDKPNVSELLIEIGLGHLVVNRPIVPEETIEERLIKLKLRVLSDIKGTVAKISETIALCNGDIIKIQIEPLEENKMSLEIILFLPKDDDLKKLITQLKTLKIESISEFNEEEELERVWGKITLEEVEDDSFFKFKKKALIRKISCLVGFKMKVINTTGVLRDISLEIAKQGVFISSVSQEIEANKDTAIINLLLLLQGTSKTSLVEQVNKIPVIKKQLFKLNTVKDVRRLGVNN